MSRVRDPSDAGYRYALERFSNSRALSGRVQGGFFLKKKPLDIGFLCTAIGELL